MKCLSLPLNVNKISVTRIYLALCNCLLKQSSPTLNNHLNKRFLNKSIRSEWSIPTKPIPIEDHTKWDFSERSLQRYSRPGGRASSGADGRVKAARGGEQADSSPSFRGACGAGTGDRHNQRVRAGPTAVTGLQGGRMVAACPLPEPPFSQQRTEGARTGKNKGRGARDPRGRRWVWGRRPGAGAAGRAGPAAAGGVRREAGCVGRAAARGSGRGVWTSECAPVRRRGALAAALPAPSRGASEPASGREKPWGAQSGSGEAGRGAHAAVGLGLLGIRTGRLPSTSSGDRTQFATSGIRREESKRRRRRCRRRKRREGRERKTGVPAAAAVRREGEPRAALGTGRYHEAGRLESGVGGRTGTGGKRGPSVAFLACTLPRRFSPAGGEEGGGRAGKPRFLCTFGNAFSPFILPFLVFSRFSPGSPVYFRQLELVVFLYRHESLFLLLETLLGRGMLCCNLCWSRSVFRKGEGTWRRRWLLAAADPRASPCLPVRGILSLTLLPVRQLPPSWRKTTPVLIPALEERNESEVISDFSPGKEERNPSSYSCSHEKKFNRKHIKFPFPKTLNHSGKKQRDDTTEVSGKLRLIKGILLDMQAL
ncbi:uncharacterized protein LOC134740222 [Pongo pygmaeus]|uniref:uncharacterized protein LOC134740222 n=1 Tax=Pongo pygmaeus TaxID=9600 RepID=UPI00300C4634